VSRAGWAGWFEWVGRPTRVGHPAIRSHRPVARRLVAPGSGTGTGAGTGTAAGARFEMHTALLDEPVPGRWLTEVGKGGGRGEAEGQRVRGSEQGGGGGGRPRGR
jgi:hypothetical protein